MMLACMYVYMMDLLPNPFCSFMSRYTGLHFVKRRPSGSLLWFCCWANVALNPGPLMFGFANCRSIRNKGPILCEEVKTGNFDVFGLTETHIKALDTPSMLNELTPEDFSLVHTSRENKHGGGVGFFIKSALDFKSIYSPEVSSLENHTVACK